MAGVASSGASRRRTPEPAATRATPARATAATTRYSRIAPTLVASRRARREVHATGYAVAPPVQNRGRRGYPVPPSAPVRVASTWCSWMPPRSKLSRDPAR
ncbi:hypothetical protein [Ornithinimicrobium kibberense]|uniref:hypothetical protein n=1 Tax=Ornithinimicrobium kibberense TaxID=282060 RepID=UPI003609A5AE